MKSFGIAWFAFSSRFLLVMWIVSGLLLQGACMRTYRFDLEPSPILSKNKSTVRSVWNKPTGQIDQELAKPIAGNRRDVLRSVSLVEMEQAIETFQRMRFYDGPTMDTAWPPMIETLDSYLDQAPERLSLSPLIRARVALEYELDKEKRRPAGAEGELEKIVGRLLVRIHAKMRSVRTMAASALSHSDDSKQRLAWPLSRGLITSGFGSRRDPIIHSQVRFHAGIDLSAGVNEPVYSAAAGVVVFASWAGKAGRAVKIKHPGGVETLYAHLSMIMVANGQRVKQGDVIGLLGSSGRTTGPHLHFAVKIKGKPVDPLEQLKEVPLGFSQDIPGIVFGWGD